MGLMYDLNLIVKGEPDAPGAETTSILHPAGRALLIGLGGPFLFPYKAHGQEEKELKILHIMSYHSPWKWTDDQFNGFKAALKGV
jgi:hypothetical protein